MGGVYSKSVIPEISRKKKRLSYLKTEEVNDTQGD